MLVNIRNPEDIIKLPWAGNYADDAVLFDLVDKYIQNEPELIKRQRADQLASIYGMGEYCEIDPNYDPKK
jgi:hypothetical protein